MPEPSPSPSPSPSAEPAASAGAWAPLHEPLFRSLWLASVVSNVGTWINDTTSAWVMTDMATSPLLVSLVQAATTLPICLLALPAGALADIVDRRPLLLLAQGWMALSAAALATAAALGLLTPILLLAVTFSLGIGAALTMPAWSASIPEMVDQRNLTAAVALGSIGINIARAIGPALGGLIVAGVGPAASYALNGASFLGVIAVLAMWRRQPSATRLPPEAFGGALRGGLRYARQSPVVQAVLVRSSSFFLFASATWALLPIVTRHTLGGDATLYGGLLAAVGVGAVLGALLLPRALRHASRNALACGAQVLYAATMAVLASSRSLWLLLPCMVVTGAAWLTVMTSFQVTAQTGVPGWVRARALSLNIVVFAGSMAAGSALWGAVAGSYGSVVALLAAAAGTALTASLARGFTLGEGGAAAVTTSAHWPEPIVLAEVEYDRGPVLVTIEYRVALDARAGFLEAVGKLRRVRRRDGAVRWGVFEDAAQPGVYLEAFVVPSWLEHLRQHERVTVADLELQAAVRAFHQGGEPPRVRHLLAGPAGPGAADDETDRAVLRTSRFGATVDGAPQ